MLKKYTGLADISNDVKPISRHSQDYVLFGYPWWSSVSVHATGPKICSFGLAEVDGLLRAIEIRSTTYFRGEVKPSVPCCKILRHVKEPYEYESDTLQTKFNSNFLPKFLLLHY
jgi:hypothetical protein